MTPSPPSSPELTPARLAEIRSHGGHPCCWSVPLLLAEIDRQRLEAEQLREARDIAIALNEQALAHAERLEAELGMANEALGLARAALGDDDHPFLHDAIADLRAEVDREKQTSATLNRSFLVTQDALATAREQAKRLAYERDRARSALEGKVWEPTLEASLSTYGNHHAGCTSLTFQDSGRCSCGFSALLDRLSPQEPANPNPSGQEP